MGEIFLLGKIRNTDEVRRELGPTRTNVVFHVVFRFLPLTLLSPVGASGSVIHDPNLDPEVLMVTGSEIPVSFPQADTHTHMVY